ncbi:dGTPase [Motilibacter rhizosphaerae]|uniref:dGTPase n=1 Tax=Motilibacter rhizosphaerae TaxID=598652 RepID=A0A4Q7NS75_9ACTN|nr:deoxyguanosinetriphosphate triphosphohydrolase [Motilibacter rhizosphaerae]RZS89700.1 dGTPase [Motilibacter rhizosphaerae]
MSEGYAPSDAARWVPEPPRKPADERRSPYARDLARLVHASGLRRLAGKTQVVHPWSDDFVRNRLTHSLEVAQIGREVARALGCDADVVETACLAHDLGHPPFGHNGERALDEVAGPAGGFEGNAQTLRLLTRLEAKSAGAVPGGEVRSVGLNLTRASLDAATKYPWLRDDPRAARGKYGAYAADAEALAWVREGAPHDRPCVEAQVMDWADDVAYSVHDLEDGVQAGLVDLAALGDRDEVAAVVAVATRTYAPGADPAALAAALARVVALPEWPTGHDGSRASLAALKGLTSTLVGRFCTAAEDATRGDAGTDGPLTRFACELVVPEGTRLEVAVLKAVAARYVMEAAGRAAQLERQREAVAALVAHALERGPEPLAPVFAEDWAAARDDADRLRVAVDAVASLTDASAAAMFLRVAAQPPGAPTASL